MPQCAVNTCRNSHRRTRGLFIKYHRFPPIPEVRNLWVRACNRPTLLNGEPSFNLQTARVCSLHFSEESYEGNVQQPGCTSPAVRNRLRFGVLPMLHLDFGMQMLMQELSKKLILRMPIKIVREKKPRRKVDRSRADRNVDRPIAIRNTESNEDVSNAAEAGTSSDSVPSTSGGSSSSGSTSRDNINDINTSSDDRPSTSYSSDGPSTSYGSASSSTNHDNVDQPEQDASHAVGAKIIKKEISEEQGSPSEEEIQLPQNPKQEPENPQQQPENPQQQPENSQQVPGNQRRSRRIRQLATRRQRQSHMEQTPQLNTHLPEPVEPHEIPKLDQMTQVAMSYLPENHNMEILLACNLWPKHW